MPEFERGNKAAKGGARPGAGRKTNAARVMMESVDVLSPEQTEERLREMHRMSIDPDVSAKVRAQLLIYLTDRVLGKPTQRTEAAIKGSLQHRTHAELIEMAKTLGLPVPPGINRQ